MRGVYRPCGPLRLATPMILIILASALVLALVTLASPSAASFASSAAADAASLFPRSPPTPTTAAPPLHAANHPPAESDLPSLRFLVGFRSYALADVHERTLKRLWRGMDEEDIEGGGLDGQCSARSIRRAAQCPSRSNSGTVAPLRWRVLRRSNPAADLPTDFLLLGFAEEWPSMGGGKLSTASRASAVLEKLRERHAREIKYVMQEKRVTRTLMWSEADKQATDEEVTEALPLSPDELKRLRQSPHTPAPGGVGDFSPPQRFDLGRTLERVLSANSQVDPDGGARMNVTPTTRFAQRRLCQWSGGAGNSPTEWLKASQVWDRGYRGAGIRVAIFDTGLSATHAHFGGSVSERTNWTDEPTLDDVLGHGTFVAGVVASQKECPGLAPAASLYIFRVFNARQLSFTSWFLDAFNYAIHSRVHVLNLSIGGPDFLDRPFVEKVQELSANGVTVVSAIGNDGPLWGTLNNPADQMDVLGVGGINEDQRVSSFSSRGMTTWELPHGYGRMKPDLVALARNLRGSAPNGGCKSMSGTSVASPVVAGTVALLASVVPAAERERKLNPAFLKQLLLESSERIDPSRGGGLFEQGEGRLSLLRAFALLTEKEKSFESHVSLVPSKLDLTDCPYMWPYCTQPLYFSSVPVVVNTTLLNSMAVSSFVPPDAPPRFHFADEESRRALHVSFSYPEAFWPWSGHFALHLSLRAPVAAPTDLSGWVELTVETAETQPRRGVVRLPLKVHAIPTPPRARRLLFDQFHNLRYPSGYFPRDNLDIRTDTLDWNGDHIHTNYRELYTSLRAAGYFVEVLGRDYTCVNASAYGALLIVDPEEEFFVDEARKLHEDVYEAGLGVLLMADWYNAQVMREVKFYDENTAEWWTPETGGSNVPALNALLRGFGMGLTDHVVKGDLSLAGERVYYASGTTIARFPAGGLLEWATLQDAGAKSPTQEYPVLGAWDPRASHSGPFSKLYPHSGRVVLYGDSNCADQSHRRGNLCSTLVIEALRYIESGDPGRLFSSRAASKPLSSPYTDTRDPRRLNPRRMLGNNLVKYSKVTSAGSAPQCPLITAPSQGSSGGGREINPFESLHAELQADAEAGVLSGDEKRAQSRFSAALRHMRQSTSQSRRRAQPRDAWDEVPQPYPARPSDSSATGPAHVLAKHARLDPASGEDESRLSPDETAALFAAAASESDSLSRAVAREAERSARRQLHRMLLLVILLCLALVAFLYKRQLANRAAAAAARKHSPASSPMLPTRIISQRTTLL